MEAGAGLRDDAAARRVGRRQIAAVLVAAALIGVGVGVASHFLLARSSRPPGVIAASGALRGEATWSAGARPAPPVTTLRDQTGHRFSLAWLHGRTVAMVFFDSHCKQECPLAGRALAASERSLPRAQRPVVVVVSVNPLDTPASTRAAARAWGLAGLAPWHWLMGDHARLALVWKAYHIYVHPEQGDISHVEALYLIDRRGDERAGFLYPYIPGSVAHDLRLLATPAGRQAGGRA
jgi:cytochrome oxidase Cu insertion factor (SCO1/SenC/PrrC family)